MARTLPRILPNLDPHATDRAALGLLIRNRRAQSGLRIDDAADQLGVSKDVLSKLENGRAVGLDKLFKVLDGLGLNLFVVTKGETGWAKRAINQMRAGPGEGDVGEGANEPAQQSKGMTGGGGRSAHQGGEDDGR
jgi:transcriptional regulator with XRE-family HTH domain